jgi:capsular polysaccharide biosynthesis protein/macrodomain Ter protein organizer (MatP/YcbG family)
MMRIVALLTARSIALRHCLQRLWPIVDRRYYYFRYADVKAAGVDALEHYKEWGRSEGRRPRAELLRYFDIGRFLVDADYYLDKYADVERAGVDPMWHYLFYGRREGRFPCAFVERLWPLTSALKLMLLMIRRGSVAEWHERHQEVAPLYARNGQKLRLYLAIRAARKTYLKGDTNLFIKVAKVVDTSCDRRSSISVRHFRDSEEQRYVDHEVVGRTKPRLERSVVAPSISIVTVRKASVIGTFQVVAQGEFIHFEPAADPANDFVAGQGVHVVALPGRTRALVRAEYTKVEHLEEAVLVSGRCSPNYYHWLVEYLGRTYALEFSPELKRLPFIIDSRTYPQEIESLKVLFPDVQIHPFTLGDRLNVDVLHIPSLPTYLPDSLKIPLWKGGALRYDTLTFLRSTILEKYGIPPQGVRVGRHIYLTRRAGRSVLNNAEVEVVLSKLGFEIVDTGTMSFREQVELFASAELIVGPLGAAFTNLIFASPGCKVLGLVSPFAVTFPLQARLASFAGCQFKLLGGIQEGYEPGDEDRVEELSLSEFMGSYAIDTDALTRAVSSLR